MRIPEKWSDHCARKPDNGVLFWGLCGECFPAFSSVLIIDESQRIPSSAFSSGFMNHFLGMCAKSLQGPAGPAGR